MLTGTIALVIELLALLQDEIKQKEQKLKKWVKDAADAFGVSEQYILKMLEMEEF